MATVMDNPGTRARSLAADPYEKMLAAGAAVLLAAILAASMRGRAHWGSVPGMIWVHLATIVVALVLTPVLLLRRRGDMRHRWLGRVWVAAMLATAIVSFGIHTTHPGGYSLIHLLSAFTLVQAPLIWWSARTHNVRRHRRSVRAMVTGALLVAGFFTFPFQRLLGSWLFG